MKKEDFLRHFLPSNYTHLVQTYHFEKETWFKCTFRIKEVKDGDTVVRWLEQLQERSAVTWRVSRTNPRAKSGGRLNIFKQEYHCHHKTDKRFRLISKRKSKNTDCEATMQIIVRRYTKGTKAKNPDKLIKEWPCIVTLNNTHNHLIHSAETLRFRKMCQETKDKILNFYHKGHSPATARQMLQTEVMMRYPEEFAEKLLDGRYNPTVAVFHHLFAGEFGSLHSANLTAHNVSDLEKMLTDYNKNCGGKTAAKLSVEEDTIEIVCICTPIMTRAHCLLKQSQELILVDTHKSMGKQNHTVYFFVMPAVAGGVPLGCIITANQKEATFEEALELLKLCLPKESCFSKNGPHFIMIDADLKERRPLQNKFPASKLLLCQYHFLKAAWIWLCEEKNKIQQDHRQELYVLIKELVYCADEDQLNARFLQLQMLPNVIRYTQFLLYVAGLWKMRHEWATAYRALLATQGTDNTNYVEALFSVFKDNILDQIKSFNIIQLTDFILTQYESYLEQRLLDFAHGRMKNYLLRKFTLQESNIKLESIHNRTDGMYMVQSETSDDICYMVDLKDGFCTCLAGFSRKLCIHISAVLKKYSIHTVQYAFGKELVLKEILYEVATGKKGRLSHDLATIVDQIPIVEVGEGADETIMNEYEISTEDTPFDEDVTIEDTNSRADDASSVIKKFDALVKRIKTGYFENPEVFIPAMQIMVRNADVYCKTETELVSAMHMFAGNNDEQ